MWSADTATAALVVTGLPLPNIIGREFIGLLSAATLPQ
jgi:hypothetical protein